MSNPILIVDSISKKFCLDLKRSLWYGLKDLFTELTCQSADNRKMLRREEFWALENVSFELKLGESIGLVGANGAGKTTLLRLISGLIKPDKGNLRIRGRIAPLIALGAGFNPILTGRENINVNMSILGLSRTEIEKRFQDVVEFADISSSLDAPLQTYSSGMQARLGFACAVHVEPDILLIDEVLSVGDIAFRGKCYRKLSELKRKGTTFIIVSHNPTAMLGICDNSLYLSNGKVVCKGPSKDVIRKYEDEILFDRDLKESTGALYIKQNERNSGIQISYLYFTDREGNILEELTTSHYACLRIGCRATKDYSEVGVGLSVRDLSSEGIMVLHMTSHFDDQLLAVNEGEAEILLEMECCSLRQGNYDLKLGLYQIPPPDMFDAIESFVFKVNSPKDLRHIASKNLFFQPRTWKVVQKDKAS